MDPSAMEGLRGIPLRPSFTPSPDGYRAGTGMSAGESDGGQRRRRRSRQLLEHVMGDAQATRSMLADVNSVEDGLGAGPRNRSLFELHSSRFVTMTPLDVSLNSAAS
jgi:hypothetical protein